MNATATPAPWTAEPNCAPAVAPSVAAPYDEWNDAAAAIDDADKPAGPPILAWLTPSPDTFKNYSCCPWATSRITLDPEHRAPCLTPVTCKRWGCSFCAPRKIRRLAYLTKGAMPNRWLRLGVKPAQYETPEAAWRDTSPKVPELCRKLRQQVGECEYLRVAEIHNGTTKYCELTEPGAALGFPHYHAMLRSDYIPQKLLSKIWGELTGAPVVWIAKIDQSFSSFRYLTKYLTKLHRLEWTDRHVSYSKNFFREEDREKLAHPQRDLIEVSDLHPWKLLADRYATQVVAARPDGTYLLPDHPDVFENDVPLQAFGLRIPAAAPPPPPPRQRELCGIASDADHHFYDQPF